MIAMRKLYPLIFAALLACSPAHAQKTKAQVLAEIAAQFPDNTIGAITPAKLRLVTSDIVASYQQYTGVNAQTGTTYTFLASDYGQLVTFNNSSAIAVTLPNPSATGFNPWNTYVRNLGTGTVTITPAGANINAAATLVLTTGQSASIVSDGVNYQTWSNSASLGTLRIALTNPALSTADPTFTTSFKAVAVDVTWATGTASIGHAIQGVTTINANAPNSGSSYGIVGAANSFLNVTYDYGGVLGYVTTDATVTTAGGTGVWGIIRGTNAGVGNYTRALRASSEVSSGQHPQIGLLVDAVSGAAFRSGVFVQGAVDTGIQIGGDGVGPEPTYPFAYYRATNVLTYFVDASGSTTTAGITIADIASSPSIVGKRADGTASVPTAVQSTEVLLALNTQGYGATGYGVGATSINVTAGGNFSDTSQPTLISFYTVPVGSLIPAIAAQFLADQSLSLAVPLSVTNGGTGGTTSTGTGAVVRANTPTLITPVLGAATGTSFNIGGVTFGASAVLQAATAQTAPGVNASASMFLVDTTGFAAGVGGRMAFMGKYNSAAAYAEFGAIDATKENGTDGNYAGQLDFYTRVNGLGNWGSVRMTISSAGVVSMPAGVAATSKTVGTLVVTGGAGISGATFTDTLNIISVANAATTAALCWNSGTGLVTENGAVGTCTVSLLAAKNLIRPLTDREGFDIVMAMGPWRYTMKEGLPTWVDGEQIGFVADYAAEIDIAKPVVARNHDGSLGGFRYEQYTAALTAAFKYLKADNDNLRNEIEQLKRRASR